MRVNPNMLEFSSSSEEEEESSRSSDSDGSHPLSHSHSVRDVNPQPEAQIAQALAGEALPTTSASSLPPMSSTLGVEFHLANIRAVVTEMKRIAKAENTGANPQMVRELWRH